LKIFENSTALCLAYLGILEVFKVTGLLVSGQAGGKIVKIVTVERIKRNMWHVTSNKSIICSAVML
jgi:hypothetical protein